MIFVHSITVRAEHNRQLMRTIFPILAIFAWATNAHAQHPSSTNADTGSTHVSHRREPSARLNFGAGVSNLRSDEKSSTLPTIVGIVRLNRQTELELEGGYWASAQDHCTERASALVASLHREISGPWGASIGALYEGKKCHDEREREAGLLVGPSYTFVVRKMGISIMPALAWTRDNHGEQVIGLHTGVMFRSWR